MDIQPAPDSLPILARGKHRSPRKGACFMEMASVLAGETWSDHPRCTHPLLARLARLVNDHTSDDNRSQLAVLIPSVVGLRGDGLAWSVDLTATVALTAIPDVPEPLQRALAVGLIRCGEMAALLEPGEITQTDVVRRAAARVPGPMEWARGFAAGSTATVRQFERRSAPHVMLCAVRGLADGAVSDPDARMRALLEAAIDTAERLEARAVTLPAPTKASMHARSA
jgi:hypothetical protein